MWGQAPARGPQVGVGRLKPLLTKLIPCDQYVSPWVFACFACEESRSMIFALTTRRLFTCLVERFGILEQVHTHVPNPMPKAKIWHQEWQNPLRPCANLNAKFWQCHSWCQIWQICNPFYFIGWWIGFNWTVWIWDCAKIASNRCSGNDILLAFWCYKKPNNTFGNAIFSSTDGLALKQLKIFNFKMHVMSSEVLCCKSIQIC